GNFQTKADYLIALNQFLLRRLERGLNTVLVIDEAQNLADGLLEQVRLLSNLETNTEKLIQIVLTGQPELRDILASPVMAPLRQRIALEHHVQPLREHEVEPYLEHRMRVAGSDYATVFPSGASRVFYATCGGCPRLINLLADRVLLAGYSAQERPVSLSLLERKAKEIADARRSRAVNGLASPANDSLRSRARAPRALPPRGSRDRARRTRPDRRAARRAWRGTRSGSPSRAGAARGTRALPAAGTVDRRGRC
ncbi:MAG: hypothetical protein E6J87_15740, partial [Deltaproteobacteria bacterium]